MCLANTLDAHSAGFPETQNRENQKYRSQV